MRLFVAIKFSPEIENALTALQNDLKVQGITGNYTKCHNLHLTLAFIGEFDDPSRVMEALSQVSFEPFTISLDEQIGNFGDILWVGTKKNSTLMSLDLRIRRVLDSYHIPYDRKTFRPHITIVRNAKVYGKKEKYISEKKIEKTSMTVEKISLMESSRIDGKLVYTEIGCIEQGRNTNGRTKIYVQRQKSNQ